MTISFTYDEGDFGNGFMKTKTDQNLDLAVYFKGDSAKYIDADGYEFERSSEALHGLFVCIGGKFYTLEQVCLEASVQYEDCKAEYEQEGREAADMERELSSPYLTGRI